MLTSTNAKHVVMYHVKENPWAEHLTSFPKRGWGGRYVECFAFNHEILPMSCLQRLDALEAKATTSGFEVES